MNKLEIKYWSTVLIFISVIIVSYGQNSDRVFVYTENCNKLISGIDNYISIVTINNSTIKEENIKAFLITPDYYEGFEELTQLKVEQKNGKYKIHPNSIGLVEFRVETDGKTEMIMVGVKPIEAVCRLWKYTANSEAKIDVDDFQAQKGLIAYVECCGFDAKCLILEFEIIKIGIDNISSRTTNRGGAFEGTGRELIDRSEPGDIYIFRNIYYECPGTEKQRSEDMIFEIE